MIVCVIAERIRFEPPLPRPRTSSPSRSAIVGDIIDGIRRPGRGRVEAERVQVLLAEHVVELDAGARRRRRPSPEPFEQVTLAQPPSPSSAVMWVVEPSRSARKRASNPGS